MKSERLAVLSDAEQFALYGLPDFDDRQRLDAFIWRCPSKNWHLPPVVPVSMPKPTVAYKLATSKRSMLSSSSSETMWKTINFGRKGRVAELDLARNWTGRYGHDE